jgi:hypothetical protein
MAPIKKKYNSITLKFSILQTATHPFIEMPRQPSLDIAL